MNISIDQNFIWAGTGLLIAVASILLASYRIRRKQRSTEIKIEELSSSFKQLNAHFFKKTLLVRDYQSMEEPAKKWADKLFERCNSVAMDSNDVNENKDDEILEVRKGKIKEGNTEITYTSELTNKSFGKRKSISEREAWQIEFLSGFDALDAYAIIPHLCSKLNVDFITAEKIGEKASLRLQRHKSVDYK